MSAPVRPVRMCVPSTRTERDLRSLSVGSSTFANNCATDSDPKQPFRSRPSLLHHSGCFSLELQRVPSSFHFAPPIASSDLSKVSGNSSKAQFVTRRTLIRVGGGMPLQKLPEAIRIGIFPSDRNFTVSCFHRGTPSDVSRSRQQWSANFAKLLPGMRITAEV